ncbi:RNA-binding protein PNO1 [Thelohanellus kitauei]|uniref:RNA-binding protein PNO1 n=1 Tax=Thelohanellus kitauei TaxID=669202 RepID=A0A0C2ND18_THEKT|nr:RNA-binding protein PNO1 [Thelohanellus kitauei]
MEVELPAPTVVDDHRKVFVPSHRRTMIKKFWVQIYKPLVEKLKLMVRYNTITNHVEFKTSNETVEPLAMQKAEDFVKAFCLGFDAQDALALIRLDNIFIESFNVLDVKRLKGEHLSRAIGRIAGSRGKMRYTLENASRTRIVIADSQIHILGSYDSIQVARRTISDLILGAGPSKTIGRMHKITSKLNSKF